MANNVQELISSLPDDKIGKKNKLTKWYAFGEYNDWNSDDGMFLSLSIQNYFISFEIDPSTYENRGCSRCIYEICVLRELIFRFFQDSLRCTCSHCQCKCVQKLPVNIVERKKSSVDTSEIMVKQLIHYSLENQNFRHDCRDECAAATGWWHSPE